jgi:hypothetical protein
VEVNVNIKANVVNQDGWSLIQQKDGLGTVVANHLVPTIAIDGRQVLSAVHELDEKCACRPIADVNGNGLRLWIHHDPDHPGALSEEEYQRQKAAVSER